MMQYLYKFCLNLYFMLYDELRRQIERKSVQGHGSDKISQT